jgi:hypothetical protein
MWLRDTEGPALRAYRSHVAQTKEVMLCVHSILLASTTQPSASIGCSPCSKTNVSVHGREIEIVIPTQSAEKRIYRDCRADEFSDSDDRIRSSRPTVNISASLCSHQSRSQSVAWSHDTSSRNKIRQRLSYEVARHRWCRS